MIELTAFRWVPPFAQGLVRDLRARWALEEAGLAYEQRLIGPETQTTPAYRAQQPFGQVPVLRHDGIELFESGAIVLYIAEQSGTLLPTDPTGRARAIGWVFAALNSVEPVVDSLAAIDLFHPGERWAQLRRPGAVEAVKQRLGMLADWLGEDDYLEDRFTAGDLVMTTVLRDLRQTDLLLSFPTLDAYRERCQQRTAFERALAAQLAPFSEHAP